MSTITVKNMKDVALGTGDGDIDSKAGTATINSWINKAAVEINKQYKLVSSGKTWVGTCTANTLPVQFSLETASEVVLDSAVGDPVNYTLLFKNNSTNAGSVIVFQQDPAIGIPNVFPLAWFSKYTFPTTTAVFTWQINFNFVWEQTGELVPGVIFSASQDPGADLSTSNEITLTYDPVNLAYDFIDQGPGPRQGSLYINQTGDVPLKQASVGIGMSGAGTFVVQAQPHLQLTFTPHPRYYVAFGTFTQGEVLDIQSLTNIAEVDFPSGVYSMTAVLNADNTWTIATTQSVNAAIATTRRNLPQLFGQKPAVAAMAPGSADRRDVAPARPQNGASHAAEPLRPGV